MEEGFNLVLTVPSAKTFLCEMTQLPQFLSILPTLRVNIHIQMKKFVFIQAMIISLTPYHHRDNEYPNTIYQLK